MEVRVEGQTVEAGDSVASALQKALSGKKFKAVVAARADNGALLDLSAPLPEGCAELAPVYADSAEGLQMIRHSTAHVMAAAVKRLFPTAKVTIGPSIDTGFYYDFDVEKPFSSEDFAAIEAEMQRIADARDPAPLLAYVQELERIETVRSRTKTRVAGTLWAASSAALQARLSIKFTYCCLAASAAVPLRACQASHLAMSIRTPLWTSA